MTWLYCDYDVTLPWPLLRFWYDKSSEKCAFVIKRAVRWWTGLTFQHQKPISSFKTAWTKNLKPQICFNDMCSCKMGNKFCIYVFLKSIYCNLFAILSHFVTLGPLIWMEQTWTNLKMSTLKIYLLLQNSLKKYLETTGLFGWPISIENGLLYLHLCFVYRANTLFHHFSCFVTLGHVIRTVTGCTLPYLFRNLV